MEFEEGVITRGSDPSRMKLGIIQLGKASSPVEVIAEDKGSLEFRA